MLWAKQRFVAVGHVLVTASASNRFSMKMCRMFFQASSSNRRLNETRGYVLSLNVVFNAAFVHFKIIFSKVVFRMILTSFKLYGLKANTYCIELFCFCMVFCLLVCHCLKNER